MGQPTPPLLVKAKRPPGILICAKCIKKCDKGRSIRKALKSGLVEQAQGTGRRPTRLVETKCMGLCPKQAVVVASGAALIRGELLLLKEADHAAPALGLLLGRPDQPYERPKP